MVLVLVYYPSAKWGEAAKGEMTRKLGVARNHARQREKAKRPVCVVLSLRQLAAGCCLLPAAWSPIWCRLGLALLAVAGGWSFDLSVFQKKKRAQF